jgi:hypothetical protein
MKSPTPHILTGCTATACLLCTACAVAPVASKAPVAPQAPTTVLATVQRGHGTQASFELCAPSSCARPTPKTLARMPSFRRLEPP